MDFHEGNAPPGVALCGPDAQSLAEQLSRLEDGQRLMADEVGRRQEIQIQLLEMLVERLGTNQPSPGGSTKDASDLELRVLELEEERESLISRLGMQQKSTHQESSEEVEDLRRRLEMALEDLREAKTKVERLEAQKGAAGSAAESLDWETQKRNLLVKLDSNQVDATERMTIQQVIDATDDVVRRKDQEIEQLEGLLQHQSENIQGYAVGAAAVAGLLETDELICQERENLERLQNEWREKLKRAEIEISMERARIARERKELDTQLEDVQREKTRIEALLAQKPETNTRCRSEVAPKNRWFSRLGLTEKDDHT